MRERDEWDWPDWVDGRVLALCGVFEMFGLALGWLGRAWIVG